MYFYVYMHFIVTFYIQNFSSNYHIGQAMMGMFQSELLSEVYHQNHQPVTALAVDSSGSAVFSADQKGHVTVWNIASSHQLHEPCCLKVTEVSLVKAIGPR